MKVFLLLPILLVPFNLPQDPTVDENSPVSVVSFKWFKDRRVVESTDTTVTAQRGLNAMDRNNRNLERQRRINDTAGRNPPDESIEARSAALERIVEESRESKNPPVDGFVYQAKIQNNSTKLVKIVFLEFQFTEKANPKNISRRQFICHAKMKPEKRDDLQIFSLIAPGGVVSVGTLKKKTNDEFEETVLINRVEYDDGSVWQRQGWNFEAVKLTLKPVPTSNKLQPCRGL
jgi:hypothetical protein